MTNTVNVYIQGRGDLEVPADIAASDENLIAALAPFYDAVDTAEITREEKEGRAIITIVPTGGRKAASEEPQHGALLADVLAELVAGPTTFNPAVTLLHRLERDNIASDLLRLLPLIPQIDAALAVGHAEVEAVHALARVLIAQHAVAASHIPPGL
jgi:hypothetical protein